MNLYVKNNPFGFELENLTRLYFPNEKINVRKEFETVEKPFVYAESGEKIGVRVSVGDFDKALDAEPVADNRDETELRTVQLLYRLLSELSGVSQPWGLLTGVRPIKLFRRLALEKGEEYAKKVFSESFFVSDEKISLAAQTERNEAKILSLSKPESFSLYVGIPFCPSRCSYCSFVMSSVERAKKLIAPYTRLLTEELKITAEIASELGLRLESVYFGGGTPTTLDAEQLGEVLNTVNTCFDMSRCREFTVEAGRPDTIDSEKLNALKEYKVGRISINPQTLNPQTLQNIGRKHTVEDFYRAFELARACGFDNINTDLIAGLPGDSAESFKHSLDEILRLKAESITVHTLCVKRASRLTTEGVTLNKDDACRAREMLEYAQGRLTAEGFLPYYLYRQTRMVGNLENVGWAKPGSESYYNAYVMDETHTILGCGSGAVTKLKNPNSGYLERIFNFKYPYEYIDRFEELIKRKDSIKAFYGQL
ncbi:MAG TPA: coproporphyrinogen dehydrogenase HemZ [Ruminococcaceae bacterium]|nr:coproporphyrinogen dehydrogenase HemZ [Oscillospiraceae bacterium]